MATASPLFLYGPVLNPGFLQGMLERSVSGQEAQLLDHTLWEPGSSSLAVLVASPGKVVTGILCRFLGVEDFRRLDAYHGVGEGLYRRELHMVETVAADAAGERQRAWVYMPTERTLERCL